ncbi:MAG: WYL domain-containing protein [Bacteroidota bacterium]
MALNKNALIRYRTIDKCLQNPYRKWTLEDLIEACSESLYEYEGKQVNVSRRTVQLDIQNMRSEKLGYNAPIEVYDRKFYRYADPKYSLTDLPINESDLSVLMESVEMLKQFSDFSLFSELKGLLHKLEDRIYSEKSDQYPIIHIDKNEQLKGLEHLDVLYQAILKQIVVEITYQSFQAREPQTFPFHGYILKEFNNRWFVVGRRHRDVQITTLALDRIRAIGMNLSLAYHRKDFDPDAYYRNTFGVTVMGESQLAEVKLVVDRKNAPYVLTKPFHHSQELLEQRSDGSVLIRLWVHQNFELERLILGFADSIEVLHPPRLRQRIGRKLYYAAKKYEEDVVS